MYQNTHKIIIFLKSCLQTSVAALEWFACSEGHHVIITGPVRPSGTASLRQDAAHSSDGPLTWNTQFFFFFLL